MRKSYLPKEYNRLLRPGVVEMGQSKSEFGSQLIDIEDQIRIDDRVFSWQENTDGTQQTNLSNPKPIDPRIELFELKRDYHVIGSNNIENDFPTWNLTIDIERILIEYIYARLKVSQIYNNIELSKFEQKSPNFALRQLIIQQVINRYELDTVLLYVKEQDIGNQFVAKQPQWNYRITFNGQTRLTDLELRSQPTIERTNFELIRGDFELDPITLKFKQINNSSFKTFEYHFDVIYKRI